MPWKSVAVAAVLVLGAAHMTTRMAFARGMAGGAHFGSARLGSGGFAAHRPAIGHGSAGHRFVIRRGFGRGFHRNFAAGGLWLYDPLWADAYGGMGSATYPGTADVAPEPIAAPVCHRSEQIVKVPAEAGGTREIKIINCPQGL